MKNKLIKLKDWFITTFKNKPSNIIIPIFSILNFILDIFLFNILAAIVIFVLINLIYFGYIFISDKLQKKDSFKKLISKLKGNKDENIFKRIINEFKNHPINFIVVIVSILILIISTLIFNFIVGIIIFVLINLVYWGYIFMSNKPKNKKKSNKKKNTKYVTTKKNGKVVKKKKSKTKKIIKILLLIFLTLFIFVVLGIVAFIIYIVKTAPEFNEKLLYLTEPSVILDKDGIEIAKVGAERRTMIEYNDLSEVLIDAIVATEDSNFFEHNGVDWARFLKASFLQLLGKSEAGGASTLTMQTSKNAYTEKEASGIKGIIRKFTDVYVSMFILEKNYTKEQILEFYVNSQWLGKNSYGVEQASLTYFGKSANELNLAEAAMIAGLFQAPGKYDPYKNPEATEARRITVLKLMLNHGYITKDEYDIAKKLTVEKIVLPENESAYSSGEVSKYQSFIDTVIEEVKEKTGISPYTTSMIIYTTMNTDFQNYLNDIMNGVSYNWENDYVQAGVAVINVHDGSVVALGGGRNINAIDTFNYATDMTNQIGSTAKPLYDYGPAVEYRNIGSGQTIVDEPYSYSNGVVVHNWDMGYKGLETVRDALAQSRNIPAIKVFQKNNQQQIIDFVTGMGLTPEIYSCNEGYIRDGKKCINKENTDDIVDANKADNLHEAHAIGGYNGESPLTMAAAYATFANYGTYNEPHTFTKVVYKDSGEEFINEWKVNSVMSPQTAYIMTDMLQTTAGSAVGWNINNVRYAAKTGTTNYDSAQMYAHGLPGHAVNDLWTVGYNVDYSIAVWYGYERINDGSTGLYNVLSSGQHNRLFAAVGKKVFTNTAGFWAPDGVVAVTIERGCAEACLPSDYTPAENKSTELYVRGSAPSTVSNRFGQLENVKNLKYTYNNNKVTLTWDSVSYPKEWTESYLRETYSKAYTNPGALEEHIQVSLDYAKNVLGVIGYNVYVKDSEGNLELLTYVTNNKYIADVEKNKDYTFVVKTAYSIFKDNMSSGKEIKVSTKTNNGSGSSTETNNDNNQNHNTEPSEDNPPSNEDHSS